MILSQINVSCVTLPIYKCNTVAVLYLPMSIAQPSLLVLYRLRYAARPRMRGYPDPGRVTYRTRQRCRRFTRLSRGDCGITDCMFHCCKLRICRLLHTAMSRTHCNIRYIKHTPTEPVEPLHHYAQHHSALHTSEHCHAYTHTNIYTYTYTRTHFAVCSRITCFSARFVYMPKTEASPAI